MILGGVLSGMGNAVLWAVEAGINAVILAVGTAVTFVLGLLPSMPDTPSVAGAAWVGWLNWLFPVAPAVAAASGVLVLYVTLLAARVALRWVRAL